MKKLIVLLCLVGLLAGCSERQAVNNVRRAFPGQSVAQIPGENDKFIVRTDDGSVYLAVCTGFFVDEAVAKEHADYSSVERVLLLPPIKK